MFDLSGKVALVTGASRGIGAAIYMALGRAGARVIGTATSEAGKDKIDMYSSSFNGESVIYDASDEESTALLIKKLTDNPTDGVDIIVANAAVNADNLLMRMGIDEWQRVINVNLTSVFTLTRGLIRPMSRRKNGRLIFISSVLASVGNAGQTNYCAAKSGIEGYCRALAREFAGRGITANAIAPGFIKTDMTAKLPATIQDNLLQTIPMKRAGEPEDIANLALYLASDEAKYITGQVIHVNGGMYMG